jgi:DNA-directed RNA polymerase subunit F
MPKKIINIEDITLSQAKGLMEKNDQELGELQKRTYDYIAKFSKFKTIKIKKLVKELETKFDLSKKEAIQVVNCAPSSVDELRAILSVKGKVILIDQLKAIIELIGKENKQPELKKTIKTKKQ